jgi:hypothetical protein
MLIVYFYSYTVKSTVPNTVLFGQTYRIKILCQYARNSYWRMNTGSMLGTESSNLMT